MLRILREVPHILGWRSEEAKQHALQLATPAGSSRSSFQARSKTAQMYPETSILDRVLLFEGKFDVTATSWLRS